MLSNTDEGVMVNRGSNSWVTWVDGCACSKATSLEKSILIGDMEEMRKVGRLAMPWWTFDRCMTGLVHRATH